MSEQTSLIPHSIISIFTDSSEGDIANLALSEEIQTQSLASHIHRFESSDESLSWTRLMEWFVEAVIGAELFQNEHPSAPPLTFENIRIDSSSTIVIAFPSSPDEPSISGSLSSDISTLCKFFLHIHRTLEITNRFILPFDYTQQDIVFARFMVALVEECVSSNKLILPNSSPHDHFQSFVEFYQQLCETDGFYTNSFLPHTLAASFTRFVLQPDRRSSFILPDHSFLRSGDAVEYSNELLDAVKKIKVTHSLEGVRNVYFDWTEWVTMMETIEKDATLGSDLSFLQSRYLRATLLSLQTKNQHIVNPSPIEENSESDSLPFLITGDHSNFSSSAISTEITLPSEQSSSESQELASEQSVFHSNSIGRHSRQILSTIHDILTRPHHNSFPWDNRPSHTSDTELDALLQLPPSKVDQNEKFDISLFDEADDAKIVASLRRCRAVVESTQSTKCIVDIDTFREFLIAGLSSTNLIVQKECYYLFFAIGEHLTTVDDPRDIQFQSLQKAFRDGKFWEKVALLNLWTRWFFQSESVHGQVMMSEFDFDFDGLLAADLHETLLFYLACLFIRTIFLNNVVSMSFGWRMDFLLSFEKRHQMMSRLTSDSSPSSGYEDTRQSMSCDTNLLGSLLSVFRGCDFPAALTELITIDLDSFPLALSNDMNPAIFLNHTSIDPKHRHSFLPMDLMFERYLRSDPDVFFSNWPDVTDCTPRKFLFTPSVGLHSLLIRSPELNLDEQELLQLMSMLAVDISGQDTTEDDINNLFRYFPPPRLVDTLLASPHLVRAHVDIWTSFLTGFCNFGAHTTPFGACSSLAKVFKLLSPFDSDPEQNELDLLSEVGEIVVSLHWLNIPAHFDSPLLCHLPSLAGAQRGVLQTLSSHSGIPSLLTPPNTETFWKNIETFVSEPPTFNGAIKVMSLYIRYFSSDDIPSSHRSFVVDSFAANLLSPIPAVASATIEVFQRFVSVSSDAVRIELVKQEDDTTLARSMLSCHLLCQMIPPEQCITNLEQFVEGLAALLEIQHRHIQIAVFPLLTKLVCVLPFGQIHRQLLFSFRHAFREGSLTFQTVLVYAAIKCSLSVSMSIKPSEHPLSHFDWDGMIHHTNMDQISFQMCVHFLSVDFPRLRFVSPKLAESIFVEFESNQHAIPRITTILVLMNDRINPTVLQQFLEFSLILSFFFGRTLPNTIVQSIWEYLEISEWSSCVGFHPSFLLNHTSSNCNRHSQPGLQDESPLFLTTPLVGLHPLFFRGLVPRPNEIHHLVLVVVVIPIVMSTSRHLSELWAIASHDPPPLAVQFFAMPICSLQFAKAWSVGCCGCVGVFVIVFGGLRKRSGSDWDSARDNATSGAEYTDTSIRLLLLLLTSSLSTQIDRIPLDEFV
ncbi:hypothetical protein BLNAU_9609 [Blattamonas nauphoetae]|uniref:Uncharacterized protein n=1 Tax=Blattamonas nauphoetae TaxID=2049346 RepID=A0ABQ9XV79_9EUKA|nr:hypothetical protein BLNAU_9609 [Blattamonas nauphoetae]